MTTPFRSPRIVGFRHPVWSSYGAGMLAGVVDFIRGHEPWKLATENDSFGEMEAVKIGADWSGDGVILFRATEEELESFRARRMAVVLTSTEGPDLGFPRVVPDNARIGALAAEHLIECAVPHFAFLARGETFYRESQFASGLRRYARERFAGFRNRLADYAREPRVHYLKGRPLWKPQTWREVETEVMAYLDTLPKASGLFVVDDALGAVALRAADRLGLRVPADLAVISFGDDPAYCFASFPALSTIVYPAREIGRLAAEVLWRQMNGEAQPSAGRIEVAPGRVIPRESTDTLAIPDPEIRDLIRHIRLTAPYDALRVSELAERSKLSLTTIKARFGAWLGHGPKQEIQRVRLAHLKILLADPTLSLPKIAERMNFGSAHELSRFFLGATGQRPSAFREAIAGRAETAKRTPQCAVIFDMDGTLFDTEPVYFDAYRRAFEAQGGELSREEYFGHLIGTANEAVEAFLRKKSGGGFDVEAFRRDWRTTWKEALRVSPPVPLPGVRELLEKLLGWGIPIGLASSSDREEIELCLESSGLADYFLVRAAGDEVAHGKPSPEVYLLACQRLGVSPECCLAIEDSPHGCRAALAADMRVVRISREPCGLEGVLHHASYLDEIPWEAWQDWLDRTVD